MPPIDGALHVSAKHAQAPGMMRTKSNGLCQFFRFVLIHRKLNVPLG